MTITHRPKSTGSALSATVETNSQINDKEPPKYHCDACSNDVTNTVRINGSEPVKHKTWHEYRVVKPHTFPIFSEDWDADEELLLIQGAEKNGIGNWQAIADYVGTRSKQECEQHYLEVYVTSPQWPLPLMDRTFNLTESECIERKRQRLQISRSPRKPPPPVISGKPITSQPTFHEIQGYMPKRFEFETEHENEAEQHVKDMVFNDDDTQEEIDLKVMVLDIYNSRLDKRQERKQLIFERGWLEFKRLQSMDRKRQREEREVYNKTRIFCRLQSSQDYDTFVQGLIREQHLRDRMATLTEWRRAGLSTLRQGDQYERDKQQRLNHLKTVAALSNDRVNGPYQRSSLRAQMTALAPCSGAAYYKDKYLEQSALIKKKTSSSSSSLTITNNNKNQLNITEADGYHLLTKEEEEICSNLHILPRPYLVIKDLALKAYAKQGFLKRKQFRDMIKIDINKANKIFDFFVENGWIKYWQDPAEIFAAQQWELQQQQFLQFQQFQQQLEEQAAAAMMDSSLLTDPSAAMNIDDTSLLNSTTINNNLNNDNTDNDNNNNNTLTTTTTDLTSLHNDLLSTTGTTDASAMLATTIDMANSISAVVTENDKNNNNNNNNSNNNEDHHHDINTTAALLQGNQLLSENMINTSLATLDSALLSTISDSMVLCPPDVTSIDMPTSNATADETTANKTTDNNDKENKNSDKTNHIKQEPISTADTTKNPIITTTSTSTSPSPSDTSTSQPTDISSTETKTTVLDETMKL
ncbi:unnamed protein product [Cunninghamella blakesleeana]